MLPIWRQLKYAAASFLDETLTHRDRAFLVDFDRSVRLRQPLTGNKGLSTERIKQVFDQIEEDLRHQHVLTYYSSQPRGAPIRPEVRVRRPGLKLRSAVPLEAIE